MRLHENKQLFADAVIAASRKKEDGGLGIKSVFIEKDYWICRSLYLMAKSDNNCKTIFKGGTSLTKAYGIGYRFSEDLDIAIAEAGTLNGNQLKNLIRNTAKNMTTGLSELVIPGVTSKGSHYYKGFYSYPHGADTLQVGAIKAGQLLIEINSFANPFPFEKHKIKSFLTEKLTSLLRYSLADNPIQELSAKIRHFYDLHYLLKDSDCNDYLKDKVFVMELKTLFVHDQKTFDKPERWQNKALYDSPLLSDFHSVWKELQNVYLRELPDLAYQQIASAQEIEDSMCKILSHVK